MNLPIRDRQKCLGLPVSWPDVPCKGRSHSGVPEDAGFPGRYVVPLRKRGPTLRRIVAPIHDYPSKRLYPFYGSAQLGRRCRGEDG